MHRLIARLLLLFAIAGSFLPLALAYAAPAHSCCVRKAVHHCHQDMDTAVASSSSEEQSTLYAAPLCNHACCRGVATWQSARPQSPLHATSLPVGHTGVIHRPAISPSSALTEFQSTRAPPAVSLS